MSGETAAPFRVALDFDGTLVTSNVAIALVAHFSPDGDRVAREIDGRLQRHEITLREAWREEVALLPADRLREMAEFAVRHATLRRGATELCELLRAREVPVEVLSGGLDFYIRPVLENAGLDLPVYSDAVDPSEAGILLLRHPHEHPTCRLCGICKALRVRSAPSPGPHLPTVFLGDGGTDRFAAEVADVVFARHHLREYCRSMGIPHYPFEEFPPVTERLRRWLDGSERFPVRPKPGLTGSLCPVSRRTARAEAA